VWRRLSFARPTLDQRQETSSGSRTPPASQGIVKPEELYDLLSEIENAALQVYKTNGLPTEAGHYAKAPGQKMWKMIAPALTPAERWVFAIENPANTGWKYGMLKDLGVHSCKGSVRQAAKLLAECHAVRQSTAATSHQGELVSRAIKLGFEWRLLIVAAEPKRKPLQLLPVVES